MKREYVQKAFALLFLLLLLVCVTRMKQEGSVWAAFNWVPELYVWTITIVPFWVWACIVAFIIGMFLPNLSKRPTLDEHQHRAGDLHLKAWDNWIKGVGTTAAIVAAYFAYQNFMEESEKRRQSVDRQTKELVIAREKDFKLKTYEKQLKLYEDMIDAGNRFLKTQQSEQPDLVQFDFMRIGRLRVLGTEGVIREADEFSRVCHLRVDEPDRQLNMPCHYERFAIACRQSLQDAYPNIDLPTIKTSTCDPSGALPAPPPIGKAPKSLPK